MIIIRFLVNFRNILAILKFSNIAEEILYLKIIFRKPTFYY